MNRNLEKFRKKTLKELLIMLTVDQEVKKDIEETALKNKKWIDSRNTAEKEFDLKYLKKNYVRKGCPALIDPKIIKEPTINRSELILTRPINGIIGEYNYEGYYKHATHFIGNKEYTEYIEKGFFIIRPEQKLNEAIRIKYFLKNCGNINEQINLKDSLDIMKDYFQRKNIASLELYKENTTIIGNHEKITYFPIEKDKYEQIIQTLDR